MSLFITSTSRGDHVSLVGLCLVEICIQSNLIGLNFLKKKIIIVRTKKLIKKYWGVRKNSECQCIHS